VRLQFWDTSIFFLLENTPQAAIRSLVETSSNRNCKLSKGKQGRKMATFQKVRALLVRLAPEYICDGCIVTKIEESSLAEVTQKTTELVVTPGFRRSIANCSMCGKRKKVVRYIKH
jgi:hypothetical protein